MNPAWQRAIASIESRGSGDYAALGPVTHTGDRAYGRYQVMGNNIPQWTETHLGRRMTPDEFMRDPEAQDKVFNGQFGSYFQQTGNPDDAASMWFTGRPLAEGANRKDQLGTSGLAYVNKFRNAMGQSEGQQAIDRQMAPKPQQAQGMQTVMPAAQEQSEGGYDWAGALQGVGASLIAVDNPRGGAVAAQLAADGRRTKKAVTYQTKYNEDTGTFFRIGSDGSVQSMRDPNHTAKPKDTSMKDKDLAGLDEHVINYDYLASSSKEAAQILKNLETGVLDLGVINNLKSQGKALTSMSDAQSRAYSQFEQFITRQVNEDLRLNKGVQTEGDAFRSLKQSHAELLAAVAVGHHVALHDRTGHAIGQRLGGVRLSPHCCGLDSLQSHVGDGLVHVLRRLLSREVHERAFLSAGHGAEMLEARARAIPRDGNGRDVAGAFLDSRHQFEARGHEQERLIRLGPPEVRERVQDDAVDAVEVRVRPSLTSLERLLRNLAEVAAVREVYLEPLVAFLANGLATSEQEHRPHAVLTLEVERGHRIDATTPVNVAGRVEGWSIEQACGRLNVLDQLQAVVCQRAVRGTDAIYLLDVVRPLLLGSRVPILQPRRDFVVLQQRSTLHLDASVVAVDDEVSDTAIDTPRRLLSRIERVHRGLHLPCADGRDNQRLRLLVARPHQLRELLSRRVHGSTLVEGGPRRRLLHGWQEHRIALNELAHGLSGDLVSVLSDGQVDRALALDGHKQVGKRFEQDTHTPVANERQFLAGHLRRAEASLLRDGTSGLHAVLKVPVLLPRPLLGALVKFGILTAQGLREDFSAHDAANALHGMLDRHLSDYALERGTDRSQGQHVLIEEREQADCPISEGLIVLLEDVGFQVSLDDFGQTRIALTSDCESFFAVTETEVLDGAVLLTGEARFSGLLGALKFFRGLRGFRDYRNFEGHAGAHLDRFLGTCGQ